MIADRTQLLVAVHVASRHKHIVLTGRPVFDKGKHGPAVVRHKRIAHDRHKLTERYPAVFHRQPLIEVVDVESPGIDHLFAAGVDDLDDLSAFDFCGDTLPRRHTQPIRLTRREVFHQLPRIKSNWSCRLSLHNYVDSFGGKFNELTRNRNCSLMRHTDCPASANSAPGSKFHTFQVFLIFFEPDRVGSGASLAGGLSTESKCESFSNFLAFCLIHRSNTGSVN